MPMEISEETPIVREYDALEVYETSDHEDINEVQVYYIHNENHSDDNELIEERPLEGKYEDVFEKFQKAFEELNIKQENDQDTTKKFEVPDMHELQKSSTAFIQDWKNQLDEFYSKMEDTTEIAKVTPVDLSSRDNASFELNSRISKLEEIIGLSELRTNTPLEMVSIQNMVNDLNRKLNLLNDSKIREKLRKEIGELHENAQEVFRTQGLISSDDDDGHTAALLSSKVSDYKILQLYDKIRKIGDVDEMIQLIIKKLQSYDSIIKKINLGGELLQDVSREQVLMSLEIEKLNNRLNDMEKKIVLEKQGFERNKKEIKNWVDELSMKIK